MQLEGKKIIVTGGSRGIAEHTVRAYAKEGATVASLDILDELGEKVATEATEAGPGTVKYYHCNIGDKQEVDTVFQQVIADMGGLDVLVNIAGVERECLAEDITPEELNFLVTVNINGTVFTNQAAYNYGFKGKGGSIINFASDSALNAMPKHSHYALTKGAVVSWSRSIASEWGRASGVRVNCVNPAIATPMYEEHKARMTPERLEKHLNMMKKSIPLGHMGDPATEIAPVMVFLASDASKYISAQIIGVNGGILASR